MFELGALGEFLIIAFAILLLFGPKEIPELMRILGRWAGKLRTLTRSVQKTMDSIIDDAELADYKEKAEKPFQEEIQKNLEKLKKDQEEE